MITSSHNSVSASRAVLIVLLAAATVLAGDEVSVRKKVPIRTAAKRNRILSAIPDNTLAVYSYDGRADRPAFGAGLAKFLSAAGVMGVFKADQQMLADAVAAILKLNKYPHAMTLLDVASKRLDAQGSFRVHFFSAALLVDAPDGKGELLAMIKQIIDHNFDTETAKLTWVGQGKLRRQRLESTDLPAWSSWEWGSIDGIFIFAIGSDAYERIANTILKPKAPPLTETFIYKTVTVHDGNLDHRAWFLYFNIINLERKLKPVMGPHYDRIVKQLQLTSASELLAQEVVITAGYRKRAFLSKLYLLWPREIEIRFLTESIPEGNPLALAVPDAATTYAVSE